MQIYKPTSLIEVRDILADALQSDTGLEIVSAATKSGLGHQVHADAQLDVSQLAGIVDYEPEELILVVRAGTSLAEVETLLESKNQMLSFEPFHPQALYGVSHAGSVGGMVASGLSGPRRISAGGVRDYVLGFKAVSGRGDEFQSGSRVMKNVTGYDLSKLMAGSFGTLAIMDEITLKVLPAPEETLSLLVSCADPQQAQSACSAAFGSAHEPTAASVLPDHLLTAAGVESAGPYAALIRLEGVAVSVADRRDKLARLLAEFGSVEIINAAESKPLWARIRDADFFSADDEQIWKISCAPTAGPAILSQLEAKYTQQNLTSFMDWAGGLIWLAGAGDNLGSDIRNILTEAGGGHATLMRADDKIRANIPVFQPQASALDELHNRIRSAFDPRQILNPGRMGR